MAQGDQVLLTKRLAIEGTSIIAREMPQRLLELGMGENEIRRCREFLVEPGISVLKEARLAARTGNVTAMHDITEGGLSTALTELSSAGGHRLRVYPDRIPIYRETEKICRLLSLAPLGLIGSGSLLLTCRPKATEEVLALLRGARIEVTCVGEVLQTGTGVEAMDANGNVVPWREFETDELARLFSDLRPPTSDLRP